MSIKPLSSVSRRDFLKLVGAALGSAFVASCDKGSVAPVATTEKAPFPLMPENTQLVADLRQQVGYGDGVTHATVKPVKLLQANIKLQEEYATTYNQTEFEFSNNRGMQVRAGLTQTGQLKMSDTDKDVREFMRPETTATQAVPIIQDLSDDSSRYIETYMHFQSKAYKNDPLYLWADGENLNRLRALAQEIFRHSPVGHNVLHLVNGSVTTQTTPPPEGLTDGYVMNPKYLPPAGNGGRTVYTTKIEGGKEVLTRLDVFIMLPSAIPTWCGRNESTGK